MGPGEGGGVQLGGAAEAVGAEGGGELGEAVVEGWRTAVER